MAKIHERPAVDRKARLKVPAQHIPKQDPSVRVGNWLEVYETLDLATAKVEAERCIQCPAAPCQAACPVGNDIPAALWKLEHDDVLGAADIFSQTNNLPEMCGRLCPQERLCEGHCVVGKNATPVRIGRLEAFVADREREQPPQSSPPVSRSGRRVAVVGAGPAGLAVAEELAKQGHAITVFDAWPEPGGVLRYGIPNFKLEKHVLDERIERLKRLPIEFVQDTYIGVGGDKTVEQLLAEGYESVFLGHGASQGNPLTIEGAELDGVIQATEFLSRGNLPLDALPAGMRAPLDPGRKVVVIGGGDTSMDCARTAVRMHADPVTLVYRRTENEMVGREEERRHAKEEGVRFEFLAAPVRFVGSRGRVCAVELERMELGPPDEGGRRRPQPVADSRFTIEADTIVLAIGYSADEQVPASAAGVLTDRYGLVIVDRQTGATDREGVFAGGDCVNGADLVVTAIRDGRIAARAMQGYLTELADAAA